MSLDRLRRNVIPHHYTLQIEPDLIKCTFNGFGYIRIDIIEPTDNIIINSKDLTIRNIQLDDTLCTWTENKDDEVIIINMKNIRQVGSYNLFFCFTGILNDQMNGFYRSKYQMNKEVKYMATTQFESTDARKAFPCFDEPSFKATFDIRIIAPTDKVVLSNTSIIREEIEGDKKLVIFETTPLMSTYLVAFIISDLEYIEKITFNKIHIRAYATPGNINKLGYVLDIAVKALEWYIRWFDIGYPLNKLDLVGIPDFSSGAMENWGLITFRESEMFCDDNTELDDRQRIAYVVCHEIAHQWFGNLVTMEWWTYLWLNETMATYFGWMVIDNLFPEWEIWKKFIDDEYLPALGLDSLESSHPIEVPVKKASEVQEIFDAISYSKGSCIIKFLVNYIGIDEFRKGIHEYLVKNMYNNTTSLDLWDAFSNERYDISNLMQCWTKQAGYPVICVNSMNNKLILSQRRFYKSGMNKKEDDNIWIIPIEIQIMDKLNNINTRTILLNKSLNSYKFDDDIEYIMINTKWNGFYHVMYTNNIPNLKGLGNEDRIQLINDGFNLALAGYQDFSIVFQMINNIDLNNERDYHLWGIITSHLGSIYKYINDNEIKKRYMNKFIIPICKPLELLYHQLGWDDNDNESINDKKLRDLIITQLIFQKNTDVIKEAFRRFYSNRWISKKSIILPTIAKHCLYDDYEKLLTLYDTNNDVQIKDTLIYALGQVRNPDLIKLSIDIVLSNKIKDQDLLHYINYLSHNKHTRGLIWDLITSNWAKFINKYPIGTHNIGTLTKVMAYGFNTEEELVKYKEFFKKRPEGAIMSINQTIERITNRILIIKRILADPLFK